MYAFKYERNLRPQECINCGVVFAIPESLDDRLRQTHRSFYCPNGHSQNYVGKTEAQKEKERADELEKRLYDTLSRANLLEQENAKLGRRHERLEKRLKAGVCPCCKRTFKQLAAHMKAKHPKYGKD